MKLISAKPTERSHFKVILDNSSRTFSGVISDDDILPETNGYVFNYSLILTKVRLNGDFCVVNGELSLATRQGIELKPVDFNKEIKDLTKSYSKYLMLSEQNPSGGEGVLTYTEIADAYKKNLDELNKIKIPILEELKLQIKDKINTPEHLNVVDIQFEEIKMIPFKRNRIT